MLKRNRLDPDFLKDMYYTMYIVCEQTEIAMYPGEPDQINSPRYVYQISSQALKRDKSTELFYTLIMTFWVKHLRMKGQ